MPENENKKIEHHWTDPPESVTPNPVAYAELDVTTNYSFLRGASHADELVYTAAMLGYRAMAVTDVNTVAGVVRAYEAARKVKDFKLVVGCRLVFIDGTPDVLVWPTDRTAYGNLCRLLTAGKMRAPKGECHLTLSDLLEWHEGLLAAVDLSCDVGSALADGNANSVRQGGPCIRLAAEPPEMQALRALRDVFGDRLSLAATAMYDGDDQSRLRHLADISRDTGIPLVATNRVHYHDPSRRMLQDVITCIRHGCTVAEAGRRLFPNGERYLKSPEQMHHLFADYPEAIARGLAIQKLCTFDLGTLGYRYPEEVVPPGLSATQYLRDLVYTNGRARYGGEIPAKVCKAIEHELNFISDTRYESYFLTVYDLVRFARENGILCQGRGSAANSAVCYCLGVTAVDPATFQLVFERFASPERREPPDIDIDFEHERREEVIQYVYEKYGRDRAAMTASVITYRGRSAVRDVGKVLGFSTDVVDQLAEKLDWWHRGTVDASHLREAGINPADESIRLLRTLSREILGFPRHLSQHVGGMVISRGRLDTCVPMENAAMENRTVVEWDKDDIHTLCMFKVDLLGLGMLTCLSKSMQLVSEGRPNQPPLELHTIPFEDKATYEMASDADTVGVFQIESRAQMSMLPRLRPKEFYDLVIEVAIVRPGPIQGDMVHPYLKRRDKLKENPAYRGEYPSGKEKELGNVLGKTLGVPLFQEQAMKLAEVAAGFTPAEADALRRSMAAWKRSAGIHRFHHKFVEGMLENGYEKEFAENCFKQISGFGEYGFPESHAASFAKLVYASAWLKRHHPAAFAAGLLNSQPMGFYAPAQIVRDAREHGVEVRPVDVNASAWDCTLEHSRSTGFQPVASDANPATNVSSSSRAIGHGLEARATEDLHKSAWGKGGPALRLGFRQIKGLREEFGHVIAAERLSGGAFTSVEQFQTRTKLPTAAIRRLAEADAFASLQLNRRHAAWEILRLRDEAAPVVEEAGAALRSARGVEAPFLPFMPMQQEVTTDYATIGMSLKRHPVSFAREELAKQKIITAADLQNGEKYPHGRWVKVAGLVLVRQRPGTASGVVFITLEDETGVANLILWSAVYERFRPAARHATLLQADGYVQREGQVIHVLAKRLFDLTGLIRGVDQTSRDFH